MHDNRNCKIDLGMTSITEPSLVKLIAAIGYRTVLAVLLNETVNLLEELGVCTNYGKHIRKSVFVLVIFCYFSVGNLFLSRYHLWYVPGGYR